MSAYACYDGQNIKVEYMLSDVAGTNIRFVTKICDIESAAQIGVEAAEELKKKLSLR